MFKNTRSYTIPKLFEWWWWCVTVKLYYYEVTSEFGVQLHSHIMQ